MVTSPHHLASQAGLDILKGGGTAVEAAIAVAACLAVVYPHMTGIGGDGFWLIAEPGKPPTTIDACGRSGAAVDLAYYAAHGCNVIPFRGPLAANTVAGTVSGWQKALEISRHWQAPLSREQLLESAIYYADNGIVVTRSQSELTSEKAPELQGQPNFAATFMPNDQPPAEGDVLKLAALGNTLRRLAADGFESFYTGKLADSIAADLAKVGSPLTAADLQHHAASERAPLTTTVRGAQLFNMAPPTQGLSSLMILAMFDRLGVTQAEGFDHIHGLIEATKQAFIVRDEHVGDPDHMMVDALTFLDETKLDELARRIDRKAALPWPHIRKPGDTIWLGVVDGQGRSVSFIQSVYFEFGSGVVLPETGICWQNRGASFRLQDSGWNALKPLRQPFHTLNPAMAIFDDGRRMVYGNMGGEGQPQTQSAVFSRYGMFGMPLQQAVSAPRWLLGKTWGDDSVTLKLEDRFEPALIQQLKDAGHAVEVLGSYTSTMGHAGAIVLHANGVFEGATDPRSDGAVAAW
jgi:gamma-glutamyltranspeptidase/glutathione hydrolase